MHLGGPEDRVAYVTNIPAYDTLPVPDALSGVVRRILCLDLSSQTPITIPARPTGCTYIGWFCQGTATATANDVAFALAEGQVHLSGQLTTFDAQFTVQGPCLQYLAELAPDAMCRFWQRDVGALCNRIETQPGPVGTDPTAAFLAFLSGLARDAAPTVVPIAQAAARIEAAHGDVAIARIAAEAGLTERQFRRQFTKVVGLPPKAFANIRRVLHALHLLTDAPDSRIADVAMQAGFYDQSHLNRAFKQYMRQTPAKLAFDEDGVLRSIVAGAL